MVTDKERESALPADESRGLQAWSLLRAAGLGLARVHEPAEALGLALDHLVSLVPYDLAFAVLLDGGGTVKAHASRGFPDPAGSDPLGPQTPGVAAQRILRRLQAVPESASEVELGRDFPGVEPAAAASRFGWLGASIQDDDGRGGFFSLYRRAPGEFAEDERDILKGVAALGGVVAEHALRLSEERRRRQEAEALREAMEGVTAALDLDQVLERILDHASRVVSYPTVMLLLLEEDRLQPVAARGFTDDTAVVEYALLVDSPLARSLREEHRLVLLENPLHVPPFLEDRAAVPIGEWIGVPLVAGGEFLGCLLLVREGGGHPADEEVALIQTFANQAAVSLQNARLFEQVRASRARLQALSKRLVDVQETERRNLARELHDQIGQLLTGLKLILEMGRTAPDSGHDDMLDEAQELVNDLMTRVRELSLDLRPAMLDDLGLLPALLWLFERYTTQTQVEVDFRHHGLEDRRFPADLETAAYRIIQEALTNVARHAGVDTVAVRLRANPRVLYLQVEDRGRGFEPAEALSSQTRNGLTGMFERAALAGGQLTVESTPGQGTLLSAELPMHGFTERRRTER